MYIYIIYILYITYIYIYYSHFYITHTYIYINNFIYNIPQSMAWTGKMRVNQSDHMCCPGFSEPNSTGASVHRIIGGSFL